MVGRSRPGRMNVARSPHSSEEPLNESSSVRAHARCGPAFMPRPPVGREPLESPAGLGEGAFQESVIDDEVFGIVERFPVDMNGVNQD